MSNIRTPRRSKGQGQRIARLRGIQGRLAHIRETHFWKWFKKDGWAAIGLLIMLAIAGWVFIIQSERFDMTDIQISEAQYVDAAAVRTAVDEYLQQPMPGGIDKNSFWLLRPAGLRSYLDERFAGDIALKEITVTKEFPRGLIIDIEERVPSISWITKDASEREHYYIVDTNGYVAQEVGSFSELNPNLPRVRDDNRDVLGIGWQVISTNYIHFIEKLSNEFSSQTGLSIDSYVMPEITCTQRQYVAESIIEQEILDSASEEFKDRKREIQEQFRSGDLSIDESLSLLEEVKKEELGKLEESTDTGAERLQWEAVVVDVDCDYVKIATEVSVVTDEAAGNFEVKFDINEDLGVQLANVRSVLREEVVEGRTIDYIDVRIPDRAYLKLL